MLSVNYEVYRGHDNFFFRLQFIKNLENPIIRVDSQKMVLIFASFVLKISYMWTEELQFCIDMSTSTVFKCT